MKLLNQSLKYLSLSILTIVTVWAVVFYISMLNEIKSSTDEGLENHKRLIIENAKKDPSVLAQSHFDESLFAIREIDKRQALEVKDRYIDTEILMQDADDEEPEPEPVRMLISAFESDGRYYELKVANSMVEEDDLIEELFRDVIWLYLLLIASIVLINNIVLKRLWRPFYDFLNQLMNFRLGSSRQLPETVSRTKEFQDLQSAVNALLKHNIDAFERQKQFIGMASHELQTPLAIASNKLELLLENENLNNSLAGRIAETYEIIQRLVRLNKSLLLLTKIESKQFPDNQTVSINKLVLQLMRDMEDQAAYKNVRISLSEATELSVEMDTSLAGVIVSNLLRNSVFHNVEGGTVEIDISGNALKIRNTGASPALDEKLVFTRFYRSDLKKEGTGLGLAIVKAVSDLYGFTVRYNFKDGMHGFEVHFKTS